MNAMRSLFQKERPSSEEKPLPIKKLETSRKQFKISEIEKIESESKVETHRTGGIKCANNVFGVSEDIQELPEESAKLLSARYYTIEDIANNEDEQVYYLLSTFVFKTI